MSKSVMAPKSRHFLLFLNPLILYSALLYVEHSYCVSSLILLQWHQVVLLNFGT